MDQTSGTNPPTDAPATQGPQDSQPAASSSKVESQQPDGQPGFRSRGRARRRARFLRRARELANRDLGGLVYNLHRFGQRNDALVLAKLSTLAHIDGELRTIETALDERQPVTVLREAGITACPRCAAIHGSEDRFCPNCGLPMSRHADLPVAGAPAAESTPPPAASPPQPAQPTAPMAQQRGGAAPTLQTPFGAPSQYGGTAPVTAPPVTATHRTAAPQAAQPQPGAGATPSPPHVAPGQTAARAATPNASQPQAGANPVPATAQHQPAPGPGVRAPVPPPSSGTTPGDASDRSSGPDEPTEIIRPQAPHP